MGRKREPLAPLPRYFFAVFGKPVSFQTGTDRDPKKSAKYAKWRDNVIGQVTQAVLDMSKGRGFEVILEQVSVRLIWYSPNVGDQADPDLDNIAKPYLDAIKGRLIPDDRNVRVLKLTKVDINSELQGIPGVLEAKNSSQFDIAKEFVLIVVEPFDNDHLSAFGRK
jgi:Holliday junction resolvase RusA-like endonuclease